MKNLETSEALCWYSCWKIPCFKSHSSEEGQMFALKFNNGDGRSGSPYASHYDHMRGFFLSSPCFCPFSLFILSARIGGHVPAKAIFYLVHNFYLA